MALRSARDNRTTLTQAAVVQLRAAIDSGVYQPGSQLPTENELVEMLNVSRTVVREALRALEVDGLITRRHGVGTFVRKQPILKNLSFNFGITEMIESAGLKPGTSHIAIRTEEAGDEMAEQLNVPPGSPLVTIERVRTADGQPVVFSLDTVAESRLQGVDLDPKRLLGESIYNLLQLEFGQVIEYGVARILPATAPDDVADKLGLPRGATVLYIVQTDYSPTDEPLLYSREYHLPDAFDFVIWRRGPTRLHGPASGSLKD